MENEFSPDLMTLLDEEGKEHEFEILDILEEDGRSFFALIPFNNTEEDVADEYYIFEQKDDNEGNHILTETEDEDLRDKLAEMFGRRFDALYELEDSE